MNHKPISKNLIFFITIFVLLLSFSTLSFSQDKQPFDTQIQILQLKVENVRLKQQLILKQYKEFKTLEAAFLAEITRLTELIHEQKMMSELEKQSEEAIKETDEKTKEPPKKE